MCLTAYIFLARNPSSKNVTKPKSVTNLRYPTINEGRLILNDLAYRFQAIVFKTNF